MMMIMFLELYDDEHDDEDGDDDEETATIFNFVDDNHSHRNYHPLHQYDHQH